MFDLDRWKEIIHTLKSNKVRTFMTAFGVFWGIFMLVIMLGAGSGLNNAINKNMGDFATNSAFLWTGRTTIPYAGFQKGRRWTFRNGDMEAIRRNVSGIDLLAPRIDANAGLAVYGKNSGSFSVNGDYPQWNLIDPVNVYAGRFINDMDIQQRRKVAVIGKRVQELLFEKDDDPLNKYIKVNGIYYKVVGVFKSARGQGGEYNEQAIYLPFTTMQRIYNYGDMVFWFAFTAKPDVSVASVADQVMTIIKKRHRISPDDDRAIGHSNVELEFQKLRGLFMGIDLLIWIVGIGTLLAGAIGVSNIMLVVVRERTGELGIRRAIGASPSSVISQVIWESVVLTLSAGWAGLACGVGLLNLIDKATGNSIEGVIYQPQISFDISMLSLLVLVISGVGAGLLPAVRAVRMKPIDALRAE